MATPVYDLAIAGFRDFARYGRALTQESISRDPLSGLVDGVNPVFHTNYAPILPSGSLVVRVGNTIVGGTANYDTGEVTLTTPPATQPVASYTFTPYTSTQILQFLLAGFDEMERRYPRGWKLVDALGAEADEASAQLLVADANGDEPVIAGDVTFGVSRIQVGFYQLCTEYRYYRSLHGLKAHTSYMWRETVRGMTVDQSKVPLNLAELLRGLEHDLDLALTAAEAGYHGENYGGYVSAPATLGYMGGFEWQTDSKLLDYRATTYGYHYPLRAF